MIPITANTDTAERIVTVTLTPTTGTAVSFTITQAVFQLLTSDGGTAVTGGKIFVGDNNPVIFYVDVGDADTWTIVETMDVDGVLAGIYSDNGFTMALTGGTGGGDVFLQRTTAGDGSSDPTGVATLTVAVTGTALTKTYTYTVAAKPTVTLLDMIGGTEKVKKQVLDGAGSATFYVDVPDADAAGAAPYWYVSKTTDTYNVVSGVTIGERSVCVLYSKNPCKIIISRIASKRRR